MQGRLLIALLPLLAFGACRAEQHASGDSASAPPPSFTAYPAPVPLPMDPDREEQQGVSLVLSVDDPELDVGEELRFRLAFRNASAEPAVVVPPLDSSWHGMRQPDYQLVFSDAEGKPVYYPLGFAVYGRCGMTNSFRPEDRRTVAAHGTLELENAHAWAPPFEVLPHARPGAVWLRVRYRADELPGVTPVEIVSNAVPSRSAGPTRRPGPAAMRRLSGRRSTKMQRTSPLGSSRAAMAICSSIDGPWGKLGN